MNEKKMFQRAKEFSRWLTGTRMGKAPRIKIGAKLYEDDVASAWINGALTVIETINEKHKKDPFMTVDEMFGEHHLIAVELFNNFNCSSLGNGRMKRINVEDFLKPVVQ